MTPRDKMLIDNIHRRLNDKNLPHTLILSEAERQALIKLTANAVDVGGEFYVDCDYYDRIIKDDPEEKKEFKKFMMNDLACRIGKELLNNDCIRFSFHRKDRSDHLPIPQYIVRASATIVKPSET